MYWNKLSGYSFPKKTIKDIDVSGKRILLRADFNVPIKDGKITSNFRITQTLPTLKYLLERKCQVVIISHLGRPEGRPNAEFSMEQVVDELEESSTSKVKFVNNCIGDEVRQAVKNAERGDILLLENLRFHEGEEENSQEFARQIADAVKPDYFVQDGFGVVHRAHASTDAITKLIPGVAGLLLEKEVSVLSGAMQAPEKPVVAVVGGAKISDKIGFIEKLIDIADTILVGGAMANTFFKQQGYEIGKSVYEKNQEQQIATILQKAKPGQIILPVDVAVSNEIAKESQRQDCKLEDVKSDQLILDVGFETMRQFSSAVNSANTVIWNGTLGYAELPQFSQASAILAESISNETKKGQTSIVGGGDTADFVLDWLEKNDGTFTHISTGGGASLELMSGLKLPGVEALIDK